jgi:hypothetical protein
VRTRFRLFAQTAVKHAVVAYDEVELEDTKLSSFGPDEYFAHLSTQRLGHTLLTAYNLASTQVLLKECAPGNASPLPSAERTQRLTGEMVCARVSPYASRAPLAVSACESA